MQSVLGSVVFGSVILGSVVLGSVVLGDVVSWWFYFSVVLWCCDMNSEVDIHHIERSRRVLIYYKSVSQS